MNEKNGSGGEGRPLVGTLERGLAILEFVSERDRPTVPEIAEALKLKLSTVYRLVDMLRRRNYLASPAGVPGVVLGTRAVKLGVTAVSRADLLAVAPPAMKELARTGFGTVFLAIPDGPCVVYVAKQEGPQALNLSARLGTRRPLHCTGLGKAYLSALPERDRGTLVRSLELTVQTPNTVVSRDELIAELSEAGRRGYAVDRAENEEGVACVAAPVRNHSDEPVAAISIAGVSEAILGNVPGLGEKVVNVSEAVSRSMGWQGRGA